MKRTQGLDAVTVTLNPAIDRTLTIPNFMAGAVNRVEKEREEAGGKGINVAAALASFGFHIAATGFLGNENADLFEDLFARKKIADHFIRIPGETRVGIKIADPVQHQTTDINFSGLSPSASDVNALFSSIHKIAQRDPTWFVLGGSLPPKVNATIYRRLIKILRTGGHTVLLDSSGKPFRHALEAVPNIIKPNIHELEELAGKRFKTVKAVITAARELTTRGIQLVVVSMGQEGACFVTKRETVIAHPPQVEVKSTVGAGDAMVAGIIAGQVQNQSLENCARLATAFSLDAISRTDRSTGSVAAIKSWMQQVKIAK